MASRPPALAVSALPWFGFQDQSARGPVAGSRAAGALSPCCPLPTPGISLEATERLLAGGVLPGTAAPHFDVLVRLLQVTLEKLVS